MLAILYARFSTDRQSETSIADQLRVCRAYAAKHGWRVEAEHTDEGVSGAAFGNRPGAQAALAALQRGRRCSWPTSPGSPEVRSSRRSWTACGSARAAA